MELGKFEREAKSKLGERELNPSAGSWDKIVGSLETYEKRTAGRKWYYIAAAVVVFAIISGSFLLNNNVVETQIVEEPLNEIETSPGIQQQNETPVQLAGEEVEPVKEEKPKTEVSPKRTNIQTALAIKEQEPVFEQVIRPKSSAMPVTEFQTEIEQYITEAVEANNEGDVADAEVDQLLAEAAAKLSKKYFEKPGTREITGASLLAEVESDLDQSFRRKVFELLKDGFEEASYAFTNRNK